MKGLVKMKKDYIAPEFELMKFKLSADILNVSDPDSGVSTGSGSGQGSADSDPFGDPNLDP